MMVGLSRRMCIDRFLLRDVMRSCIFEAFAFLRESKCEMLSCVHSDEEPHQYSCLHENFVRFGILYLFISMQALASSLNRAGSTDRSLIGRTGMDAFNA
ncbi:Tubulin delta chain [Trichinella spiralis]|uniref:Tubulin delta chain n=1 Tax=Trichinella spiralis TaxID=6334 RepID=A0ABR3K482_TRISP